MLLEKARTVLAEADGFVELAGRAKTGVTNRLRVGMARGLCEVVNRIRLHLMSRVPEITIEGSDIASSEPVSCVGGNGRSTSACRATWRKIRAVRCEALFANDSWSWSARTIRCRSGSRSELTQLADEPLLLHKREWAALSHDKILQLYASADVTPNIVTLQAEPGDQASMLAVASGKGISLASQSPVSRSYLRR